IGSGITITGLIGRPGQKVTLRSGSGTNTYQYSAGGLVTKSGANAAIAANNSITFINKGGVWLEV
ncbi:MAG: hypothetical protein J6D44_19040, partial [Pseudomonas sp.]|nr:hypothetical protein [Pseudomonas sp.]